MHLMKSIVSSASRVWASEQNEVCIDINSTVPRMCVPHTNFGDGLKLQITWAQAIWTNGTAHHNEWRHCVIQRKQQQLQPATQIHLSLSHWFLLVWAWAQTKCVYTGPESSLIGTVVHSIRSETVINSFYPSFSSPKKEMIFTVVSTVDFYWTCLVCGKKILNKKILSSNEFAIFNVPI